MVKLLNGTRFVDTFKDNTSRHVVFEEQGRIPRDQIKRMSPYVDPGFVWVTTRHTEEFDAKQAKEFPEICPLRKWDFETRQYHTCGQGLNAHGECPEHKKVRYTVHEAAQEAKERQEKDRPTLRKEPPRRRAGGRTVSRLRTRYGW